MSYQVLARKWRPKKFEEIVGQKHIVQALVNSLKNQKIAQAYLLTGLRGVGKTTIARIFAKAAMCMQPLNDGNSCGNCPSCISIQNNNSIDLIEIDGATNNGVENIRQLIENVQYLPVVSKYKVYIIDEVHMLSVSAFNALLKTLEEPPKHVIFIFATTDPQKLLGTVISRCQRFDCKNLNEKELFDHIKKISLVENIKFENEHVIKILVKQGAGSARDTLSLLDQALSLSKDKFIDEVTLAYSLGIANTGAINKLLENLFSSDVEQVEKIYRKLNQENIDLKNLLNQILSGIFEIIQNIDNKDYQSEIDNNVIDGLSISELIWIYEVIAKDSDWILNSIAPTDAFEILLKKVTLRKQILSNESRELSVKKKSNLPIIKKKNWDDFLPYLFEKNPAIAANLEHGNILNFSNHSGEIYIEYGFKINNKLFFDYINEKEIHKMFINNIKDFFECEEGRINLNFKIINSESNEMVDFKSKSEIIIEENEKLDQEKKNKLINNKYIKEAQEIFVSKIDKIIIDK